MDTEDWYDSTVNPAGSRWATRYAQPSLPSTGNRTLHLGKQRSPTTVAAAAVAEREGEREREREREGGREREAVIMCGSFPNVHSRCICMDVTVYCFGRGNNGWFCSGKSHKRKNDKPHI
jgi:hypothetical protein